MFLSPEILVLFPVAKHHGQHIAFTTFSPRHFHSQDYIESNEFVHSKTDVQLTLSVILLLELALCPNFTVHLYRETYILCLTFQCSQ